MRLHLGLSKLFWAEAVNIVVFLINHFVGNGGDDFGYRC